MRKLGYCAVLSLVFCASSFASFHYVGRTLKPTGQAVYGTAKAATYPARHPKKTAHGVEKGVKAVI